MPDLFYEEGLFRDEVREFFYEWPLTIVEVEIEVEGDIEIPKEI